MKHFPLGPAETNRPVMIIKVLFGAGCIILGIFWLIFNIRNSGPEFSLWITVLFLFGFGLFQIWAGSGRAARFIDVDENLILLRKSSILPVQKFSRDNLDAIALYAMSIVFFKKNGKKTILRFGTEYSEFTNPAKDAVIEFAESNNIKVSFPDEIE
jgi:hypothetical protein